MDQSSQVPELLPCPFCAGPAEFFRALSGRWDVVCPNDSCAANNFYRTQAQAAAAWNNRGAAERKLAEDAQQVRDLFIDKLPADHPWRRTEIARTIAAERAAADRRVAEALKRATAVICYKCRNERPLEWDGGSAYHDGQYCEASRIHALIAAEEAAHD